MPFGFGSKGGSGFRNPELWYELEWSEVVRIRRRYESWHDDRLVLDSLQPRSELLQSALAYVSECG